LYCYTANGKGKRYPLADTRRMDFTDTTRSSPAASIPLPSLQIDLKENRISGNGGCNNYFASIEHYSSTALSFSAIGATRMLCLSDNIENAYFQTLQEVATYKIQENSLSLLNKQGEEVVKMIKKQ